MTEPVTVGRNFYPGRRVLLRIDPNETLSGEISTQDCFRLVFVEKGSGIMCWDKQCEFVIAPMLFCFNEKEHPDLAQGREFRAQSLYFHPSVIRSDFTLSSVRNPPAGSALTDYQDLNWLVPFTGWDGERKAVLRLDPVSSQKVSTLLEAIGRELDRQGDDFWPCRSRAFFLELLFLVQRLVAAPQPQPVSAEVPTGMDSLLMFLHMHYQENITVAGLSWQFNTNRTSLEQRFQQFTSIPLMAYLTQYRIRLSALTLRDTELTVSEILIRVGFRDNTNFSRMFCKYMNCAPSEYRKQFAGSPG